MIKLSLINKYVEIKNEFDRWFKSAKLTLKSAKHELNGGFYNGHFSNHNELLSLLAVKAYFYGIRPT